MEEFLLDGELDGGPCVGVGHGTPACATLSGCCRQSHIPNCEAIADAGEQDACLNAYYAAELSENCDPCEGQCLP
jgi:hypothetical protein